MSSSKRSNSKGKAPTRPGGSKPKQDTSDRDDSKALEARGTRAMKPFPTQGYAMTKMPDGTLVPEGYTMRKVEPAKNYDVISMARAMNADMGPKVKKLFDTEREAALEAQQTGLYIGWRCPEFTWDCQRVGSMSKCFCGHLLREHEKFTGRTAMVPCRQGGCKCKGFTWIPSKPEEIGEFWFQRRRDFDVSTWRAKCRCKHTHEEHEPTGIRRCKAKGGCGCGAFDSNFLCAACDKHWEQHQTFFDYEAERKQNGLPYGADYLPFAEIPSLRNMVLTGEDDGDMSYMRMMEGREPIPQLKASDNSTVVPYGGTSEGRGRRGASRGSGPQSGASRGRGDRGGEGRSGFRPAYE